MAHRGKDWFEFEERAWGHDLSEKPGKSAERPKNVVNLTRAETETDVEKVAANIRNLFACIGCGGGVFTKTDAEV